ncbi:MAG: hypothetical protein ACRYGR_03550 [Janthinobacterium lividum]
MIFIKTNLFLKFVVLFVLCPFYNISQSTKVPDDLFPNVALRKITLDTSPKEPNLEHDALSHFRKQARRESKIVVQRSEFSWPIYECDFEASQAFSDQYLQPLKDAEELRDNAQSFADKQFSWQKIKTIFKKMKENCSFHYINFQCKEAAYIWHAFLNSPHYKLYSDDKGDIILADQKKALFYFSSGQMNLAALELGKKLIEQEKEDKTDLKNILKAYANLSIIQSQQDDHLDFILDVCIKFHSKEYKKTRVAFKDSN